MYLSVTNLGQRALINSGLSLGMTKIAKVLLQSWPEPQQLITKYRGFRWVPSPREPRGTGADRFSAFWWRASVELHYSQLFRVDFDQSISWNRGHFRFPVFEILWIIHQILNWKVKKKRNTPKPVVTFQVQGHPDVTLWSTAFHSSWIFTFK